MSHRRRQRRQGELRSHWDHDRTLGDLLDDLTNVRGIQPELGSSAEKCPCNLVEHLRRKDENILPGDPINELDSFFVLGRVGRVEGVDEDVGVNQNAGHALEPRS